MREVDLNQCLVSSNHWELGEKGGGIIKSGWAEVMFYLLEEF